MATRAMTATIAARTLRSLITAIPPAGPTPRGRVVRAGHRGRAALRHVRRHFITRDNLRRAIAKLVNATFEARDPAWWGTGTASGIPGRQQLPQPTVHSTKPANHPQA